MQGQHGDAQVFDQRDADDLVDARPAQLAVDRQGGGDVGGQDQPAHPGFDRQAVHLGDDEDAGEAEEEHRPDAVALLDGHQGAVHADDGFLGDGPPAVDVDAGEEQAALQQHEEHIEEADQVAGGGDHGVVPEGVDGGPGEEVAVVFAGELADGLADGHFLAEEQAAARVFHQQHPDEQDDDRALRGEDGDILGQAVVPDVGLGEVEQDEEGIGRQGEDVDAVQAAGVFEPAALAVPDQTPEGDLVGEVKAPGGGVGPEGGAGQAPVIPGRALIGEQGDGLQALAGPGDEGGEDQAEGDAPPQGDAAGLGLLRSRGGLYG